MNTFNPRFIRSPYSVAFVEIKPRGVCPASPRREKQGPVPSRAILVAIPRQYGIPDSRIQKRVQCQLNLCFILRMSIICPAYTIARSSWPYCALIAQVLELEMTKLVTTESDGAPRSSLPTEAAASATKAGSYRVFGEGEETNLGARPDDWDLSLLLGSIGAELGTPIPAAVLPRHGAVRHSHRVPSRPHNCQ